MSSGRRTKLSNWLVDLGLPEQKIDNEHIGFFVCSRFYQLLPGEEPPKESRPVELTDLRYMRTILVRGDNGIFSVMTAAERDDDDFRALMKPEVFHAVAKNTPDISRWF